MSIEYTNQPIRLKITAELEFEDGQSFTFNRETTDFTEDDETVDGYFGQVSSDVYDKLEEFSVESEDDYEDDEDFDDREDYTTDDELRGY